MARDKRKKTMIFGLIGSLIVLCDLTGCSLKKANSTIDISSSDPSGVRVVELHLGEGENQLVMEGEISMKSGGAQIDIKTSDTDEVLYSKSFNSEDSGSININIGDLSNNLDLILRLDSKDAKDLTLHLESDQKLTDDMVKPEIPEKEER